MVLECSQNQSGGLTAAGAFMMTVRMFGKLVGHVANDGRVYTEGVLDGCCIGRVESNGCVYDGVGFSASCVGKVEAPHIFGGGADLLLLIR
jgi:hypothetical protein